MTTSDIIAIAVITLFYIFLLRYVHKLILREIEKKATKQREPVRYKMLTRGDKIRYQRNGEELEARIIFNNQHTLGVFAMPIKSKQPEFINYLDIKEKL